MKHRGVSTGTAHFLPLDRYLNKGYHEIAACGAKAWRYNITTNIVQVECDACIALAIEMSGTEPAPQP